MNIKKIAAAALVPAVGAGIAVSVVALAQAAPAHPKAHAVTRVKTRTAAHVTTHHAAPAHKPAYKPEWVTVRSGDALSGIAAAHRVSWQELYATWPNPRTLHGSTDVTPGERLRIPADPAMWAAVFTAKYAAALQPKPSVPAQPSQAGSAQPGTGSQPQSLTAGMSSFEQCVAWRESSNTPTDPDGLFGILPSTWASLGYSGTAGQASVALQKVAFNRLYAEYGTQPWAPSDGC